MTDLAARIVAAAVDGDLWDAGRRIAWADLCAAIEAEMDSTVRQQRFDDVVNVTRQLIAQQQQAA